MGIKKLILYELRKFLSVKVKKKYDTKFTQRTFIVNKLIKFCKPDC